MCAAPFFFFSTMKRFFLILVMYLLPSAVVADDVFISDAWLKLLHYEARGEGYVS